jgi:protease-4
MTDKLAKQFLDRVARHRKIAPNAFADISTARIYMADEALDLGLVDRVGYLNDAITEAIKLAGLPEDAKIVVYRRTEYPDDNIYNTAVMQSGGRDVSLVSFKLPGSLGVLTPGFYYLWPAAVME